MALPLGVVEEEGSFSFYIDGALPFPYVERIGRVSGRR
jgi:hypothetical protein